MELPKNGSIVIIDDKINEAMPLMTALAKRGVAYIYYDGKPRNYPEETLDSVRFVFLDMHLDEVAGAAGGNKNIVSSLIGGLDAVVGEDNGPYIIMVWSKHDSQHMIEFKQAVLEKNGLKCRPIAILNMEKAQCFETVDEKTKTDEVEWRFKDNGLKIIEKTFEEQIKLVNSFVLLYNWENGVRESAKETMRAMGTLFDTNSQKWNENLKASFVKIAKAYAGASLELSDENIIQNSYYAMNDIANDFNCVRAGQSTDAVYKTITMMPKKEGIKGNILLAEFLQGKEYILSCDLNTFYIYEDSNCICEKKQIDKLFIKKDDKYDEVKEILCNMYWENIGTINSLLNIRHYILDQKRPGNVYESSMEMTKELCEVYNINGEIQNEVKGIEIEISPICDFAQAKRKRLRILPGLQVPYSLNLQAWNHSKYTYISVPMKIDGTSQKLLFDFRYFTSQNMDYLNDKKSLFAVGDEMLQNIKEELLQHGVRSGIAYVD